MSSIKQSFESGQAHGTGEEKTGQLMDSARNAASTVTESARGGTENASGFLQQTGEQVKSMAQGAVDAVKNNAPETDNSSGSK